MNFGQTAFQPGPSPIGPVNGFSNNKNQKRNDSNSTNTITNVTSITNDPYLTNDFYPLTQAHRQILTALRADESSADADLYRRIASYGSNGNGSGGTGVSTGTGHLYHPIDDGEDGISGVGSGGGGVGGVSRETSDAEMSNNSSRGFSRDMNGGRNGGGFGGTMNGVGGPTMTSPLPHQHHQQHAQTPGGGQWSSSSSIAVSSKDRYCTLSHSHSIPLPPYLTNLLKKTKLSSLMGFLEKGNMVWVSVDDTLYLWEYGHGTGVNSSAGGGDRGKKDFVTFKVPSGHCIVSVGLVKPKPGVFTDVVEWGLVVTTPEEAILCALARESKNTNTTNPSSVYETHLKLIPTRYVIPTDSVPILTICGDDDGRIFMGGYDGSLYEMMYESSIVSTTMTRSTLYHNTIDDEDEEEDSDEMATIDPGPSIASSIASGSKRALSLLVFGPSTPGNTSTTNIHNTTLLNPRPRKCRKVNHTSLASPIITAFVPGFVLRAASAVFGSGGPDATRCGQIVEMTLDGGRKTLYALTSGGFIHAFDVSTSNPFAPNTNNINSNNSATSNTTFSNPPTPPKLCATIDVNTSIRAYLTCVALGNMSPPRASSDLTVASIQFPGGGAGARAGVGSMETARYWKKRAEGELAEKGKKGVGWSGGFGIGGGNSSSDGGKLKCCLHPISIHVVPPSESKCLTLVVISAGGLRYYLSVLPDAGTRLSSTSVKPGNRFTLCHVRGPPSLVKRNSRNALGDVDDGGGDWMLDPIGGMGGGNVVGSSRSLNGFTKVKSMYASGVTLLAIGNGGPSLSSSLENTNAEAGDSIVALTPDYTDVGLRQRQRQEHQQQQSVDYNTYQQRAAVQYNEITPFAGSGVNEIVSLPTMYGSSYDNITTGGSTNTIPGGRVWDMAATAFDIDRKSPSVWNLFFQSKTPLEGQWSESVVPAIYFPPSSSSTRAKLSNKVSFPTTANSSVEAAQASSSVIGAELQRPSNTVDNGNGGLISMAMNLASSMFFRPYSHGARPNVSTTQPRQGPAYRISRRVGCGANGFSCSIISGGGGKNNGRTRSRVSSRYSIRSSTTRGYRRSGTGSGTTGAVPLVRLPILKPITVPLAEITMQHLLLKLKPRKIATLNSGGLNFFTQSTPIEKLRMALLTNSRDGGSSTVARDGTIKAFFESYGSAEGCAMCLTIAIQEEEDVVARKAVQAAMNFANQPRMIRSIVGSTTTATTTTTTTTPYQSPSSHEMVDGHDISGYHFSPSFLHDGLVALISRLLRPIWCKPAIVISKGRTILGALSTTTTTQQRHRRRGGDHHVKMSPAKVELLLDEVTLQDIRRPLAALQVLVKDTFSRAVNVVPGDGGRIPGIGVNNGGDNSGNDQYTMRDDNSNVGGGDFITRAIRYQSQASVTQNNFGSQSQTNRSSSQTPSQPLSEKDLNDAARLKEERSIHSLYRLISRAVQALNLISRLRHAHSTPELPEVEFGLLHGLTFSQIVTMKSAQDRIEAVLTHLFSSNQAMASSPDGYDEGLTNNTSTSISSVESNNLSSLLSRQCYLYFSIGSRLTYLGFQTAHSAMTQAPLSTMRTNLVDSASSYLRRAARHWYNASLVTGRSLREEANFVLVVGGSSGGTNSDSSKSKSKGYEGAYARALECGSPLSRAAAVLMELQDVAGVVDVCLICASNFGGRSAGQRQYGGENSEISNGNNDGAWNDMLPWEKGLYHRPMMQDSALDDTSGGIVPSSSQPIRISSNGSNQSNSGIDASHSDAQNTCYAILFHHLGVLLTHNHTLVDRMVSVAISSSDLNFHHELFAYLATGEYVNTLLRIDSPNLEKWLKEYQKDKSLLWRYYMIHGFYWMAGDVMQKRGCSVDEEKVCLEERIECLTRAVNYYSAALKNDQSIGNSNIIVSSSSNGQDRLMHHMPKSPTQDEITRFISLINDQIDIAKLQSRALSTIRSSQNASKIDATKVEALSNTLIDVTVLFNEFAEPLALFDLCLLILQTCDHNDTSMITTLWRSILCEEVLPCKTSSVEAHRFLSLLQKGSMSEEDSVVLTSDDVTREDGNSLMAFEDGKWVTSLKNRVISLGKELYGKGADYAIPLEFLTESLEGLQRVQMKSPDNRSTAWVLNTLIEAGASYASILDAYNSVMATQDKELDPVTRLTHLSSVSEVLMQWVSSAFSKSSGQSGRGMLNGPGRAEESSRIQLIRCSGMLFQQIDAYKAVLESLIGCNNDDTVRVLAQLSDVEYMLQRHIND